MNKKAIVLAVLIVCFHSMRAFAGELTVAVAANVQYAFEELKDIFEKDTGIVIVPVFGSSGKFTTQIRSGAPFDVFLSADMEYPETLHQESLTLNTPKIYAYGTLVLWSTTGADLSQGIEAVNQPSVKKIALASPETAPYGRQSVNALKHHVLYDKIEQKLVYGESIAQVNQFIMAKSVEMGFTAKSVVLAPNMKDQGRWIEIDQAAYEPIAQGAVILKYAEKEHLAEANKFFDFLYSPEAGAIFEKYGYILP